MIVAVLERKDDTESRTIHGIVRAIKMISDHILARHSDAGTALPAHFNALVHELDRRRRGRFGIILGGQSPWAALQAWED
jgi:hypothetical protein